MNLAQTLEWASTVLWHLDHPQSKSRQGITEERMTEKLGWLRDFAPHPAVAECKTSSLPASHFSTSKASSAVWQLSSRSMSQASPTIH